MIKRQVPQRSCGLQSNRPIDTTGSWTSNWYFAINLLIKVSRFMESMNSTHRWKQKKLTLTFPMNPEAPVMKTLRWLKKFTILDSFNLFTSWTMMLSRVGKLIKIKNEKANDRWETKNLSWQKKMKTKMTEELKARENFSCRIVGLGNND